MAHLPHKPKHATRKRRSTRPAQADIDAARELLHRAGFIIARKQQTKPTYVEGEHARHHLGKRPRSGVLLRRDAGGMIPVDDISNYVPGMVADTTSNPAARTPVARIPRINGPVPNLPPAPRGPGAPAVPTAKADNPTDDMLHLLGNVSAMRGLFGNNSNAATNGDDSSGLRHGGRVGPPRRW